MIRYWNGLLSYLLTPVLFFLAFPPFPMPYLAFLCLIPFLDLIHRSRQLAFREGYLSGLLAIGLFLYWINFNSGATPFQAMGMYLAMVLYLALWWGLFAVLQKSIVRRTGIYGWLAAPLLWTAIEYAQSFGALGFPWHSLATTQTMNPSAIRFIEFTGMYGITAWVVAVNALIYVLWQKLVVSPSAKDPSQPNAFRLLLVTLVLIFILPLSVGFFLKSHESGRQSLRFAILQPNIEPNRKWLERDFAFHRLMQMTRALRDTSKHLILWPETAIPSRLRYQPTQMQTILEELRHQKTALLTGIPDKRIAQNEQGEFFYRHYNSVFLIGPDSSVQVYDKIHLVPLGEYVPDFLYPVQYLAMDVGYSGYSAGEEPKILQLPIGRETVSLAAVVCYESVFSGLVREFVLKGAEMLVIVTNDAWYDGTIAPDQHAYIAVLRALEHRMPVVRCANSGVSCIIAPDGEIITAAPNPSQATLIAEIQTGNEGTFFTRYGDWFPLLMIAGVIVFLARAYVRPLKP